MGKLYSYMSIIAIATVMSWSGIGAYLAATGRISAESLGQIARILRGEPPTPPVASQPAPASQAVVEDEPMARSADEVREQRKQEHLQSLRLDRARRDVDARVALLKQAQLSLVQEQEAFETRRKQWEDQRRKLADKARDEGFERELALVGAMAPKQAKDYVIRTWRKQPIDAVRLVNALPPVKSKKLLDQFKTEEEQDLIAQLLEQLRLQQADVAPDAPSH